MSHFGPGEEVDGRFRIVDRLGSGSMGVVFRAEDIWLGRPVAIKVVDFAYAADEAAAKHFQAEARALAQIRHENVVNVYTFGKHAGAFYFAMEFVDGVTLDTLIDQHSERKETIELSKAIGILSAIARGLAAVHERKLVHRDVKPGNVVIEKESGRPVLVDFGLARRAKVSSPRATTTAGTPSYMSPEQARDVDGTKTTAASDLYALACTAFELFTGRPVFDGDDIYSILLGHLNDAPPMVSSLRPELAPLDGVFARALAKSPEYRQTSTLAFLAEVEDGVRDLLMPKSVRGNTGLVRVPGPDAVRMFLLEADEGLVRQITRAADRSLTVPSIDAFTNTFELLAAFERNPAQIIILDEDTAQGSCLPIIETVRKLPRGTRAEIIVLTRTWEQGPSHLAAHGARELPKPLNMQVLVSVLRSVQGRVRG